MTLSKQPVLRNEIEVTSVGRFLKCTIDKGLVCQTDKKRGLGCCVGAEFSGGQSSKDPLSADNFTSRSDFEMLYFGAPML